MSGLYNRSMQDVSRQSQRETRGSPYSRPAPGARPGEDRWQHDKFESGRGKRGGGNVQTSNTPSAKLAIQGLHYEVSEEELRDLFDQIGPTVKCFIRYDRSGRSTGAATVIFKETRHAVRAKQEYDGANAKGQPISITFDVMRESRPIAGASDKQGGDLFNRLGGGDLSTRIGGAKIAKPPANAPRGPASGTARPGPHRGMGGDGPSRQPRGAKVEKGHTQGRRGRGPAPTADSLDAELDAFMKTPSGAAESIHAPKSADGDTNMV